MSGELRLGQFRYTITPDDDFVIGSPLNAGVNTAKYLVFQTSHITGFGANPHIQCGYNASTLKWDLTYSNDGAATSTFAWLDVTNTFTQPNIFSNTVTLNGAVTATNTVGFSGTITSSGTSTFSGPFNSSGTSTLSGPVSLTGATTNITSPSVTIGTTSANILTINSSTTVGGSLTVNGNFDVKGSVTTIESTVTTIADPTITLNRGGAASSGGGAGIQIEEAGATAGYLTLNSNRLGWDVKVPGNAYVSTLIPSGTASITLPSTTGTLALISDVTTALSTGLSSYVTLGTAQTITAIKTFDATTGGIFFGAAGVNASISGTGDGVFNSLNVHNIFSVNSSGVVAGATFTGTSFSGNHLGSLAGYTLPTATGLSNQALLISGATLVWGDPGLQSNVANTFTAIQTFNSVSGSYQGLGDYASYPKVTSSLTGIPARYETDYQAGVISFIPTGASAIPTFGIDIGGSNSHMVEFSTASTTKLTMELATTLSSGSSVILKDRTTGTRYELYVSNGVFTIAPA